MNRMGGACSMQQRQQQGGTGGGSGGAGGLSSSRGQRRFGVIRRNGTAGDSERSLHPHRSLRHSVVAPVPDGSIASLYPVDDNYVLEDDHTRSPKSLADLCIDTICRSLPDLNGELPVGLPQDVVDDLVQSLMRHSALNATTLKSLRNCELGILSLASCRGVTDEWLEPLSRTSTGGYHPRTTTTSSCMDAMKNTTPPLSPNFYLPTNKHGESNMDIEGVNNNLSPSNSCDTEPMIPPFQLDDMDHHPSTTTTTTTNVAAMGNMEDSSSSSSCSTSSFLSASSTPCCLGELTPSHKMASTLHSQESPTPMDHENDSLALLTPAGCETTASGEGHDFVMEATCYDEDDDELPIIPPLPVLLSSSTANLTLLDLRGSQRLTDRGLLQLVDLTNLRVAKLDHCHSLTGRGLLAFSNSHNLHTLSLANCRRLTDEGIINVSHLVSLESLSLDGCRCLTDRALAALGGIYDLHRLDLSQCDLITDDGLEHLSHLEDLEELSLGWCRSITDRGINTLTAQSGRSSRLRILRLARCVITDEGVGYLGRLESLEELDLNGCASIGSTAMGNTLGRLEKLETLDVSYCPGILRTSWQSNMKQLKSLILAYSGVTDSHLSRWMNLPCLQELSFDSCPVGDWAITHLADNNVVPNLTTLDLADTDLTDIGMSSLPKFKNLVRLSLFYCNISNNGLRHLSQMTDLEVLNLDSREVGDEGLWHLRNLTKLKALDIFSGSITDSGCSHIAKITSLESLELCGGGIGDLGCNLLANLENLTTLNLSQNDRITNRGAAALATLSKLKALNLSNTRVNSAALRFFSGLTNLQSLALYGCRGIDDGTGLDSLQNGLPSLKCLRLNGAAEEDGIVVVDDENTYDEDEDEDNTTVQRDVRFRTGFHSAAQARYTAIGQGSAVERPSQNAVVGMNAEEGSEDESAYSDHD